MPGAHASHSGLAPPTCGPKEPVGHGEHCAAPSVLLYVPSAHSSHSSCPSRGCAVEGVHGAQYDDCDRLAEPAPHTKHCSGEVAPVPGWRVPAGHAMQAVGEVEPVLGLYVPTGQSVGSGMAFCRGALPRMP